MSDILSYEKTLQICKDTLLINYWCTRLNSIYASAEYMIGLEEINRWITYFNNCKNYEMHAIGSYHTNYPRRIIKDNWLKKLNPVVVKLLAIGDGKISLCGGAIIDLLNGVYPNDYDLFFHCSLEEADDLFNKCLGYIVDSKHNNIKYSRSRHVLTVKNYEFKIQFIKRVYQTKEQVLFGFDLAACRMGYNLKDGLFTTICGGISFAMKAFPLDLSKYGISYRYRMKKYINNKNYKVLLPSLSLSFDEKEVTFDKIDLVKEDNRKYYNITKIDDSIDCDYHSDVIENCSLIIKNDYDNVTFTSAKLLKIQELSDKFVEKQMRKYTPKAPSNKLGREEAMKFLGDRYKEFALAYYVEQDNQKAVAIWEEKIIYYIGEAQKQAQVIKNNPWTYSNPGSKNFGQIHPLNVNVREWYGEHYQPLTIGIADDLFCVASKVFTAFPQEISNIIFEYWLQNEVHSAKDRLFNLKKNDTAKITCCDDSDDYQ